MIMTYKVRVARSVAICKPYYSHTLIAFSGASFIVLHTWAGNYSHLWIWLLHVIYNAAFY